MRETNRRVTLVALLLSTFMSAMEMTVVSTAMPTVVADLGGIELYSWVFAAYMLATTVTTPIYGKLADLLGRKPVMLFGLALFLVGSLLSGTAHSMPALIGWRTLQGLGAGAMQPISLTLIGDLFSLEERSKMQGLFGSVWGLAGIAGPVLGGVIVKYLSWHWIFWINLPLGLASAFILSGSLHEKIERKKRVIDVPGALVLSAGIVALLAGSHGGAWALPALFGGAACIGLFVFIEKRAPEPLLPLDLFQVPLIAVSSVIAALVGASMMATVTYVPLYVQAVMGATPTDAASAITPMVIGWPIASAVGGRILTRVGVRRLVRVGLGLTAMSSFFLAFLLDRHMSLNVPRVLTALFGAGLGFANTALMISVQTSVPWNRRGVATASSMFFRTIGGTLSVGALGAVLVSMLSKDPAIPVHAADALLGPEHGRSLAPEILKHLSGALESGLGVGFWAIFAMAGAAFLASLAMPDLDLNQDAPPKEGAGTALDAA